MSLTQDLANLLTQIEEQLPDEAKALMAKAGNDIAQLGIHDHSLKAGDAIPAIALPNATGEMVSVHDLLKQGPVVITFYRGGWCPYCNMELRALQQALPEIKHQNASLVAISPEVPDSSLSTQEKNALTFEVLSDVGNAIARKFGLVFTLPDYLRPVYQAFGIDLVAANGDETFELPVPATYVVNVDGIIAHAYINIDYTKREDPEMILAELRKLKVAV